MQKVIATIAGVYLLSGALQAQAATSDLDEALRLATNGNYPAAAAIYRNVLANDPAPEVRASAGKALTAVEALMRQQPSPAPQKKTAPTKQVKAGTPSSMRPHAQAQAAVPSPVATRAVVIAPAPSPLDAALALLQVGRYGEAAALYRQILSTNPSPEVKRYTEQALGRLEILMQQGTSVADLATAKQAMESNPMNMDALFAYAQGAAAQGKAAEAEKTYLRMLELDPSLDRVRMDLALLYVQQGDYAKAQPLLEHAIANEPPLPVKARAQALLGVAQNPPSKFKRYGFEGSLTAGYNHDFNANAGSSTDAISLFDTTVDLPDGAKAQDDGQAFMMGGISHTYNFAADPVHPGIATRWYSTGTAYKSEQINLDELDLSILSGRTGPIFEFLDYRTTLGFTLGYTYVKLGGDHYLNVISGNTDVKYALTPTLSLTAGIGLEDRAFFNNPNVSTHETRSGNAHQASVGAIYTPTPNDSVTGEISLRRENAQVDYFTDVQTTVSTGYTHAFEGNIFTNIGGSYRDSTYDGPDFLISTTTRQDKEVTGSLMVGKLFEHNILTTLGYQYRNVDSNIQNYNYDNHRLMSSVGVRF